MNGLVLLTGTVAGPDDSAEAERLVQAFVGEGTQVVSRLKSATPLQVNLQVKIAEVSRALVKEIGVNLLTRDTTGGFQFNVAQGRAFGDTGIGVCLDCGAAKTRCVVGVRPARRFDLAALRPAHWPVRDARRDRRRFF